MRYRLFLVRFLAVLGLAASSASLADQLLMGAPFCGFESGCGPVTSSPYGWPLGIPLPVFGLLGFAAVLVLSLMDCENAAWIGRVLAAAGGLAGVVLILIQAAVLGQLCWLCLVADGSAIGIAVAAFAGRAAPGSEPVSSLARAMWAVAAVIAFIAPLAIAAVEVDPDPPPWVQAYWTDDAITIVEVTDFECEHCRKSDEFVRDRVKGRSDVRLVRLPVQMPNHENARSAAIAYLAAKSQGRGEEMAEALFASPSLIPQACRQIAVRLGLRMDAYDRAVADPATDAEVGRIAAAAKTSGPGVPMIWVQGRMIYGVPTPETFDPALRRARPPNHKK